MAPERPNGHFRASLDAALQGLRGLPLADLDPGALAVAFTLVGDAIRLGTEVPGAVMREVERVSVDAVRRMFAALGDEVRTWSLDEDFRPGEESPGFDWVVRRRDQVESVVVAARRLLTPSGVLLDELEEARAVEAALRTLDFTREGQRPVEDVERALGERIALATRDSWVHALAAHDHQDAAIENVAATDAELTSEPSDEAVEAYITRGELVRWIEGAARRLPSFAEELEAMIGAGVECRSTVAFPARRWAASRSKSAPVVSLAVLPQRKLAAASDERVDLRETVELGLLFPLDAVASLTVGGELVTLNVYPSRDIALARVTFGPATTTEPDAEAVWRVATASVAGPIRLRVEAADGTVFDALLRLDPAT